MTGCPWHRDGGWLWHPMTGCLWQSLSARGSISCVPECPCVVDFGCLQVLVALACDLELDTLPCCAETHKWAWFRRYCMASRVAVALDKRTPLPRLFLDEVQRRILESRLECRNISLAALVCETAQHIRQQHFSCQGLP